MGDEVKKQLDMFPEDSPKLKKITKKYARRKRPKPTKRPKSEKRAANMAKQRLVSVFLRMSHSRNGMSYGPGRMKLPNSLALDLLHEEELAREVEAKFQGTRGVIIGGRSRSGSYTLKEVPVETFDISLNDAEPFDTVKGNQR